jgi:hypothetical protein
MWSHDQLNTIIDKISTDTAQLGAATRRRIAVCSRTSEADAEIKAASEIAIAASRDNLNRRRE